MADKPNSDQTQNKQAEAQAPETNPSEDKAPETNEAKADKPEAKAEDKPEAEPKPEPKAEVKPEAEPKPEPKAEVKEEAKPESKPISADLKKLADKLVNLNVLEVSQLSDYLKSEYGIEPAAAVVGAGGGGAGPAGAGDGGGDDESAKSEYTVTLKDAGAQKIAVIKAVKDITGLGLGEAKAIIDEAPKVIKENVPKDEAEDMKAKLEEAGASVELS